MAIVEEHVMVLGAWYSPFVRRVEWALKVKGVNYQLMEEDLNNKSSLLLQSNPIHKKVPVLFHHGKPLPESLIIIQYIDEAWPQNPILPHHPYERAMAIFWAKFVDEKFTEAIRRALFLEGEKQEKEVKQAVEALEKLEAEIKGKKFFGGETMGFVDIVLGWITIWLGVIEEVSSFKIFDSQKYPCLLQWSDNFLNLPLIKESSPRRDNLVIVFQKIRQAHLALAAEK